MWALRTKVQRHRLVPAGPAPVGTGLTEPREASLARTVNRTKTAGHVRNAFFEADPRMPRTLQRLSSRFAASG